MTGKSSAERMWFWVWKILNTIALELVLGFPLFSVYSTPWWNLFGIMVLNTNPTLKTLKFIFPTQISYISNNLWDIHVADRYISLNVPQKVFLTFSLHTGSTHLSGRVELLSPSPWLPLRFKLLLSLTTAFISQLISLSLPLPVLRFFSTDLPEGSSLNEIHIKSLPCSIPPKVFFLH